MAVESSCSVDETIREAFLLFLNVPPSFLPFNPFFFYFIYISNTKELLSAR